MKKITIELDDRYADVLAVTAIGHCDRFDQNISTTLLGIKGRDCFECRLVCVDGDVERPEWKEA